MYKEAPEVINRNVSQENLQRNSCCCGQCGVEGRECENGKNRCALNGLKKTHYGLLSPPVFCCHPFFKLSLQSASLLWRTSRFGAFFYLWMLFGSFLNLKDLIFYKNSQINTSNSDFLPKHIWTYPKIKIYFDSHPFFSLSLSLFQITLNCLEILLALL